MKNRKNKALNVFIGIITAIITFVLVILLYVTSTGAYGRAQDLYDNPVYTTHIIAKCKDMNACLPKSQCEKMYKKIGSHYMAYYGSKYRDYYVCVGCYELGHQYDYSQDKYKNIAECGFKFTSKGIMY